MGAGSYWNNHEYFETQYKILTSMRVSLAVVQALGLTQDRDYVRRIATHGGVISDEQVAEHLIENLTVAPVKESRLAVLRYEDSDPVRAQRILAKLVDVYTDQNLENVLASTNSAVEWLRGQLDHLRQDLEASEMRLHEFKLENRILSVAIDDQSNMLRAEMKQLNEALTSVRTKRSEVAARLNELSKVSALDPAMLPSSELLASPVLQSIRKDYAEAIRKRTTLLAEGKGPNHPETAAATAAIAACRTNLLAEVRNIQGAVTHDVSALQSQEGTLSDLFERANEKALDLNLSEIEYTRLLRAKENNEKVYSMVLERTKEGDLTRMLRVNNVHVIDRPILPRVPIRPLVPLNIAFGAFAGLVLGIMAAMGRGLLDRTVKTPIDVETELGMTFLGLLPEATSLSEPERRAARRRRGAPAKDGSRELLVHHEPHSGVAEASRAIRTNITFMAPDHPHQDAPGHERRPRRGQDHRRLLARHLHGPGRAAGAADGLRSPPAAAPPNLLEDGARRRDHGDARRRPPRPGLAGHRSAEPLRPPGGPHAPEPLRDPPQREVQAAPGAAPGAVRPDHHRQPARRAGHRRDDPLDPGRRDNLRRSRLRHHQGARASGAPHAHRRGRSPGGRRPQRGRPELLRATLLPSRLPP